MLSSDTLEEQFGPTELEILDQDDETRIICTKTVRDGQVVEISQVTFGKAVFPEIHRAIVAGTSMGKAFRQAGVEFQRQVQATYQYALPPIFAQWFANDGPAAVVDVAILVGPQRAHYARILEMYSPAVRWPVHTEQPPDQLVLKQIDLVGAFLAGRRRQ